MHGKVIYRDNRVATSYAGTMRGRSIDRRNDENSAIFAADLKTDPGLTAGSANTNVLILRSVKILRVRIEVGNHASYRAFKKRLIVD